MSDDLIEPQTMTEVRQHSGHAIPVAESLERVSKQMDPDPDEMVDLCAEAAATIRALLRAQAQEG